MFHFHNDPTRQLNSIKTKAVFWDDLATTGVSEERIVSIIRVARICELQ
jgi:hypothetical protein